MEDVRKKSDSELSELVQSARETVRQERFKDKFSRKAGIIRNAKTDIARALTELTARQTNKETKQRMSTPNTTSNGRVLRGKVVSSKMTDTITVAVERYVKHPKYKKYLRRTKKFLVHDAGNTAKVGETVEIKEVNPISKRKSFALVTTK